MGLESLDIALALEEEFEIELAGRIVLDIDTVADLQAEVLRRVEAARAATGGPHPDPDTVRERVAQILAQELAIERAIIQPDHRLIVDLGMDA